MTTSYQADSIKTLDFFEHIRKYPGMYIGSKDIKGLHHCIKEIISNSIDEYLNGAGDKIIVKLQKDGGILIEDNARGIPHGIHSEDISILRACFGLQNTGGKYINASGEGGYNTSGGEHGIGLKAVNALSTKLIAISTRDGIKETVEFKQGKFIKEFSNNVDKNECGLSVLFYPDKEIFETVEIDIKSLREMIREFSYLCSGLKFIYEIEAQNAKEEYFSENGLVDYINYLSKGKSLLFDPIYLKGKDGNFQIETIVGYTANYSGIYKLYTNNIPQEKGTHLTGFKTAWTICLNQWARDKKLLKDNEENLAGSDFEEGQILILNFKMIDPVFKGQNKEELSSSEGRTYVQRLIAEEAKIYFNTHEKEIRVIIDKAVAARRAREAAKKAREAARNNKERKRKKVINPDKLKDAENLGQESILLCVEGNSAGASMAVARDTAKYGILALRGKPINLFTNSKEKIDKNEEIQLLISALGITPGAYRSEDLRYGKIAIASDSDSDGYHIGLLISAAIQTLCPEFIKEGRLCWLRSPLYIVKNGKNESYYYTDEEMDAVRGSVKGEVQRAKGLGALSAKQAQNSMFTDANQRLDVLEYDEAAINLLYDLLGESVAKRKNFIFNNLDFSQIRE